MTKKLACHVCNENSYSPFYRETRFGDLMCTTCYENFKDSKWRSFVEKNYELVTISDCDFCKEENKVSKIAVHPDENGRYKQYYYCLDCYDEIYSPMVDTGETSVSE